MENTVQKSTNPVGRALLLTMAILTLLSGTTTYFFVNNITGENNDNRPHSYRQDNQHPDEYSRVVTPNEAREWGEKTGAKVLLPRPEEATLREIRILNDSNVDTLLLYFTNNLEITIQPIEPFFPRNFSEQEIEDQVNPETGEMVLNTPQGRKKLKPADNDMWPGSIQQLETVRGTKGLISNPGFHKTLENGKIITLEKDPLPGRVIWLENNALYKAFQPKTPALKILKVVEGMTKL